MNLEGDFLGRRIGPMRHVILEVARVSGVTPEQITGPSRQRSRVRARQMAMLICHEYCQASLPEIGRVFNRDHSTVKHGVDRTKERITPADRNDMKNIARRCGLLIE